MSSRALPMLIDGPGPSPGSTVVFATNGSICHRIPTGIRTFSGIILAFAEKRLNACGDGGRHRLVLRRSKDGGNTWGPVIVVVGKPKDGKPPCVGCTPSTSNPNPVEVLRPDGSRAILMHYTTLNNPTIAKHGIDRQVWSFDEGLTWEQDSAIAYPPVPNLGGLIGPSTGLQSLSGRIYFSALSPEDGQVFLYWSRDFGASWKSSSRRVAGVTECSIAFRSGFGRSDERILMHCRMLKLNRRAQIVWSADGEPGSVVPVVIDPNSQGSLINAGQRLFMSSPNSSSFNSRRRMTVRSSHDGGAHWDDGVEIWRGASAYSQLIDLKSANGELGLLFESGRGKLNPYETISFTRVSPR